MKTKKFKDLYFFHSKSTMQAGEGLKEGEFPFYTSSEKLTKWTNNSQFNTMALVFGTGGKANVHFASGRFSVSTDCLVASSQQQHVNIKFVFYYLSWNIHILERGFKGAGIKHISKKYIEKIDIPIFPLETQNKIVSILDKVSVLIAKRVESIEFLDKLLNSTFLDMFGLYLKNLDKKSFDSLVNICDITSGVTKGRKTKETDFLEVPYLRVANIQDGYLNLAEIKTIQSTKREIEQYKIIKHDIFLTEGGDPDKLGRGAIWEEENTNFIFQNHLYRVRVKNEIELSPYWLLQLIGSSFGKGYFAHQAKQTTGIATINSRQVKQFPVPIVPIEKQHKFENVFHSIKQRIAKNKVALGMSKILISSISQRAFNGDLNFNIDEELNSLLKEIDLQKKINDLSKISNDTVYLQRLIDKLNNQEFKEKDQYDKAKYTVFQLLKEGKKVIQQYKDKRILLALP